MFDAYTLNEKKIKSKSAKQNFQNSFHEAVRNANHDRRKRKSRDVYDFSNLRESVIDHCVKNSDNRGILDLINQSVEDNKTNKYNREEFKTISKFNDKILDQIKSRIAEIKLREFNKFKVIRFLSFPEIMYEHQESGITYQEAKSKNKKGDF